MTYRWVFAAAALGLAAMGCTSESDGQQAEPTCDMGAFFADCGCDGEPALGCIPDGDRQCRWFVGGCAPSDYVLSDCAADDICCAEDWPFDESAGIQSIDHYAQLYAWGLEPWDAEREMNVSVTVDSELAPAEPSLTCDGLDRMGSPCGMDSGPVIADGGGEDGGVSEPTRQPAVEHEYYGATFALYLEPSSWDNYGWYLVAEVTTGPEPVARVCRLPYTDATGPDCGLLGTDPVCATSGMLTLDSTPADAAELAETHGTLSVTFPDGSAEASF